MSNKLLTRKQVAAQFGMSVSTLARWAGLRKGPQYIKLGGSTRYRPEDVEAYINSGKIKLVANDA